MTRAELLGFLRRHELAVEASVGPAGVPQAAVVGYVVTDALEIFFDTLASSRKAVNLEADPRCALVVGWDEEQTVQVEGVADFPTGAERQALLATYLRRFPDGYRRLRLPDITHVRVRPRWIRYSDFRGEKPVVAEWDEAALSRREAR